MQWVLRQESLRTREEAVQMMRLGKVAEAAHDTAGAGASSQNRSGAIVKARIDGDGKGISVDGISHRIRSDEDQTLDCLRGCSIEDRHCITTI